MISTADRSVASEALKPTTLPALRSVDLHLEFTVVTPGELQQFPGVIVHGLLEHVLRETECRMSGDFPCAACLYRPTCAFGTLFGEPDANGSTIAIPRQRASARTPPRPYVIAALPDHAGTDIAGGERIRTTVRLFGDAIRFQGAMAHALLESAPRRFGLKGPLVECLAVTIDDGSGTLRLAHDSDTFATPFLLLSRTCPSTSPDAVTASLAGRSRLESLTPVRLPQWERKPSDLFSARKLLWAIINRVNTLARTYQRDLAPLTAFRHLLEEADQLDWSVTTREVWQTSVPRNRGDRTKRLTGRRFTIDIGPMSTELRDVFAWGIHTHVGSDATLGLGRLRLTSGTDARVVDRS